MGSQRCSQGVRAKYAFIKAHRNEFGNPEPESICY